MSKLFTCRWSLRIKRLASVFKLKISSIQRLCHSHAFIKNLPYIINVLFYNKGPLYFQLNSPDWNLPVPLKYGTDVRWHSLPCVRVNSSKNWPPCNIAHLMLLSLIITETTSLLQQVMCKYEHVSRYCNTQNAMPHVCYIVKFF